MTGTCIFISVSNNNNKKTGIEILRCQFRARFSYRRILIGTSDKKPKHCLSFPVVLTTCARVFLNKIYVFVGSVNSKEAETSVEMQAFC